MPDKNLKITLASTAFILFFIIIIGLVWLAGGDRPVSVALAYAAGLSMIFLPCTLPLVFVVVPLSMGKGYKDIKDEKIRERTHKTFKEWTKILNKFNVKANGHTSAAKYLKEKYKLTPWWSQVITIKYEYGKGLRK